MFGRGKRKERLKAEADRKFAALKRELGNKVSEKIQDEKVARQVRAEIESAIDANGLFRFTSSKHIDKAVRIEKEELFKLIP